VKADCGIQRNTPDCKRAWGFGAAAVWRAVPADHGLRGRAETGSVPDEPDGWSAGCQRLQPDFASRRCSDWIAQLQHLHEQPAPQRSNETSGEVGFIDKSHKLVILRQSQWFDLFSEELQLLRLGGYIDRTGKPVIPLQFDDAKRFQGRFSGKQQSKVDLDRQNW